MNFEKRCFSIFTQLKSNTVKLAKYIYDLLLENETVIIPGFGAFISTYKPAEIGDNEIKPPSKEISFTRQIRNNDGMLVMAIARKAKISQPNALKRIERERENMLYQLDKGEKIDLKELGTLFYNEQNEIQFLPFQDDNLLMDSFGFQTILMDDVVEEVIEPEPVEAVTENVNEPEIVEKVKPTIEVEGETESVTEKPIEKIELPRPLPVWAIQKPVERKKAGWYWHLLILIPIFIGAYFIVNKLSNSTNKEIYSESTPPVKKQEIIVQTIPPADTLEIETLTKKEAEETVKIESRVNTISTETKYYLVGGGFKKEENAEKFIVRLKERGIEGFMLGQKGNLYLVGIESFNTSNEAYNSLNEIVKKYPDWNLWVCKK